TAPTLRPAGPRRGRCCAESSTSRSVFGRRVIRGRLYRWDGVRGHANRRSGVTAPASRRRRVRAWPDPTSGPGRDGKPSADSGRGSLSQGHLGGVGLTVRVRPGQGHGVSGLVIRHGFGERIAVSDRGRPDRGDRVSGGKACLGGGSVLVDPGDDCTLGGCGTGSAGLAVDAGPTEPTGLA